MAIYFYGCTTMDGYLADKNHQLEWLFETGSPEETNYKDFYQKMDIAIMGRRTFNSIEGFDNIKTFYPTTINYVFTHDEQFCEEGFIPVQGDIIKFIQRLDPKKNIWIVGGNTILAPLLDQNLVDVIILQIAPVLLGNGVPLFTQKDDFKRFKLQEVHQFGPFAEMVFTKNLDESTNIR